MNRGQLNSPFNRNNSPDVNKQLNSYEPLKQSLSPDFIPFGYSSPLSSIKNGRQFNKPYNKGVMRLHDRSCSSPSSNGSSNFFSPNSSSNSIGSSNSSWSGHYNRNNNYNRFKKNQFRNPNNKGYNSDQYYHWSMIEDPWVSLEKKLIEEVGAENMKVENRSFASDLEKDDKKVPSSNNESGSCSDSLPITRDSAVISDKNIRSDERIPTDNTQSVLLSTLDAISAEV